MSLKEKIKKLKDNIEIARYKLCPIAETDKFIVSQQEKNIIPQIIDYSKFEYSVLLEGMKLSDQWSINELKTQKISNGKDVYFCTVMKGNACVAENRAGSAHPLYYNIDRTETRYMVSDGQKTQVMLLRDNKILKRGEGSVNLKELVFFGDETVSIPLQNDTDINDINAVRYQLEGANLDKNNINKFIDKFVIVTPEQRSTYKEYKKKRDFNKILNNQRLTSTRVK